MKIALILPRSGIYRYKTGAFSKYIRYAPLTLNILAALVPPHISTDIEIYDEGIEVIDKEKIKADIIGITSITGASSRGYAYADYFRSKGIPVIYGGVHATLMSEEVKKHSDSVIIGQAFETWPLALEDFIRGELKPFYYPPEKIDFSKIPVFNRKSFYLKKGRFITNNSIQAVYGCPNSCEFCATPVVCQGYQHRPVEDVVHEVEQIREKHFIFVDPSPIENVEYAKRLYKALEPLNKKWTGLATTRLINHPDLMDIMGRSGCIGLLIGFESLSQGSNDGINKKFNNIDSYYGLVKGLHQRDIAIMGCFVHGLDNDDKDCFKRTLDFVDRASIDLPRYTVCTPFPGTPFFEKLKRDKRILTEDWALYDAQHVVFKPMNMTADELEEGHKWIWKESYRAGFIAKRMIASGTRPLLTFLTNISYRRYAKFLPLFHKDYLLKENMI